MTKGYPVTLACTGDHVRKRRMDMGLSRPDAARAIGVHFTTLQGWEEGRRNPTPRFTPAVIRFLGYVPFDIGESPGERLKARRRTLGMTRPMFAAELGVHFATLDAEENEGAFLRCLFCHVRLTGRNHRRNADTCLRTLGLDQATPSLMI